MNENLFALAIILIPLVLAGRILYKYLIKPFILRSRLIKNGIDGTATIISLKETGLSINRKPEIEYEVRVVGKNGAIFNTSIRRVTSVLEIINSFQLKTQHPVKFDADSKEAIFLS